MRGSSADLRGTARFSAFREVAYRSSLQVGLVVTRKGENIPGVIEAFSITRRQFPDDPQVTCRLAQRALAYEQDKELNTAAVRI